MQSQNTEANQKLGIQSKILFINSGFVRRRDFLSCKWWSGFLTFLLFPACWLGQVKCGEDRWGETRTSLLSCWLPLWADKCFKLTSPFQGVLGPSWGSPARPPGLGDASSSTGSYPVQASGLRIHPSLRLSLMEALALPSPLSGLR